MTWLGCDGSAENDSSIEQALTQAAALVENAKNARLDVVSESPAKSLLCSLADGNLDRRF